MVFSEKPRPRVILRKSERHHEDEPWYLPALFGEEWEKAQYFTFDTICSLCLHVKYKKTSKSLNPDRFIHSSCFTLLFSFYRWASLLWATEMSSLSPILAAAWHLAASPLASSSMACPSPSCSTSFPTTMPNWRNKNTHFQTQSAPSSSRNVWGASLTTASNPSQRSPTMSSTFGLVEGNLFMRTKIKRDCPLATLLTLNGLITHGSSARPHLPPTLSLCDVR